MATTLIGWRPSALPAARPSIGSTALGNGRLRADAVLHPAVTQAATVVEMCVSTPSVFVAGHTPALKINNYIGTPAALPVMGAAVEGATTSSLIGMATDLRDQQYGADKVKGSDARGIPPRGRRAV